MRLRFHQTGHPVDVLKLETWDPPQPQRHEVLVRLLYAPINPADLNFIEGRYGKLPQLPATPGNEGCGRVDAVGEEVNSLAVGDLVAPLDYLGCWSQHVIAAESHFAKLPTELDPIQGSMLRINPGTAWRMLHEFDTLKEGDFIAQNAANSGVGQAVIQVAKSLGIRTINFVRRPELIAELTALGATAVFLDNDAGHRTAQAFLDKQPLKLALNAVGGESALRLMELLSQSGTLVTYGAMSRQSLKVPNKYLIFKDLQIRGFWLSKWIGKASHTEIQDTLRPLANMMGSGKLTLKVDKVYPLEDFAEALRHAQTEGRAGKVLFSLDGS